MAHIPLTTQEAARGALAAVGTRFMPLATVIDYATALLQADRDDPEVAAYLAEREFEVRLAHERDEEARYAEADLDLADVTPDAIDAATRRMDGAA